VKSLGKQVDKAIRAAKEYLWTDEGAQDFLTAYGFPTTRSIELHSWSLAQKLGELMVQHTEQQFEVSERLKMRIMRSGRRNWRRFIERMERHKFIKVKRLPSSGLAIEQLPLIDMVAAAAVIE
jgi:hypothetical protein